MLGAVFHCGAHFRLRELQTALLAACVRVCVDVFGNGKPHICFGEHDGTEASSKIFTPNIIRSICIYREISEFVYMSYLTFCNIVDIHTNHWTFTRITNWLPETRDETRKHVIEKC